MGYDLNILYYFGIFKKYYKKIAMLVICAVFIAVIISVFRPPTYTARCTILLTEPSSGPSISNLSKFIGFAGFSFDNSSANTIIAIVKSRRMSKDIYLNFPELNKRLNFNLKIEVYDTTTGTVVIEVKGADNKLVADIANFCARNLDAINEDLDITPQRPMVKVLDEAIPLQASDSRHTSKRVIIGAIFAFVVGSFFFFALEYYRTLTRK